MNGVLHRRRKEAVERPLRRGSALAAGLLLSGGLVGCQGSAVSAPAFDNEAGHALTCMTHQKHRPTSAYTGGQQASSELLLGMFAYYTANGTKAYCDRKPPTDTDRTWARRYVGLGGTSENVAPILATQ